MELSIINICSVTSGALNGRVFMAEACYTMSSEDGVLKVASWQNYAVLIEGPPRRGRLFNQGCSYKFVGALSSIFLPLGAGA